MNGPVRKIEILSPFNQAIELTRLILFRPFDITKWLIIGFAAFLSGWLNSGGRSINPWSFRGWNTSSAQAPTVPIPVLQSRPCWRVPPGPHRGSGRFHCRNRHSLALGHLAWPFHFYHCLVRNRAAIAEPWREYHRKGNRFFLFLIVLIVASIAIVALLGGFVFGSLMLWRNYHISNTPALLVLVPIAVFAWVAFAVVVNLILYFMPPVMYTRRCSPGDAARAILRLILDDPVPFILFILFMLALWIGWIMVGCLVTCLTCCRASLPYIGTVMVLPVPVFFRSFSLLFLRQFGADWDVWSKIPVPETTTPPVQTIVPAPPPAPAAPMQETTPPASEVPPEEPNPPERSRYEPPESPPLP